MSKLTYPCNTALAFLKKYDISELDEANLKSLLYAQGYTLVRFERTLSGNNVHRMVSTLSLEEAVKKLNCFTYSDRNYKLVFLNKELSSKERTLALAKEQWNILEGHFINTVSSDYIPAGDRDAKEFADFILNPPRSYKVQRFVKHHLTNILAISAIILFILSLVLLGS